MRSTITTIISICIVLTAVCFSFHTIIKVD